MKDCSKIASLPRAIRDELNHRLDNGQRGKTILDWVNALPDVQAILKEQFNAEPVNKQNLSNWKKSGFRHWQLCQAALNFTQESLPDDLDDSTLEKMSSKLIRCLQIRYAALAASLPPPSDDPQSELRLLASLCDNVTALRRGDLFASRLSLEQKRFAMDLSKTETERERLFWEWTQRPEIQAKINPKRDPVKVREEALRLLDMRLLGIVDPKDPIENPDPAALI